MIGILTCLATLASCMQGEPIKYDAVRASQEERNARERENGFCGNPYSPHDWPFDEESGAHNGPRKPNPDPDFIGAE